MSQATELLIEMKNQFNEKSIFLCAINNDETIEYLNDNSVYVQDLCEQETWTLGDGSYITRNEDLYFTGEDISDFELTHSIIVDNLVNKV